MYEERLTGHQKKLWMAAAVLTPAVQLAAGASLPGTLAAVGIWALLSQVKEREQPQPGQAVTQWLLSLLAAVQGMHLLSRAWPEKAQVLWIPVILLLLAVVMAGKGTEKAAWGGILLLWAVGFLTGSVLLSAIPEVRLRELGAIPEEKEWLKSYRLLGILLTVGLGYPWVTARGEGKTPWKGVGAAVILSAVCTQGVLSLKEAGKVEEPFYELSRSVRYLGTMERFESLAVMGILLGGFLYLSFLMAAGSAGMRSLFVSKGSWILTGGGILSILGYFLEADKEGIVLTTGVLVLGYILPGIKETLSGKKARKRENNS